KYTPGKDGGAAFGGANTPENKIPVPSAPRPPFVGGGFRMGTPASTTRGFGEVEIRQVADWICDVLDQMGDESVVDNVRAQVLELCSRFPVYADK
ncbi:MAG TPA: serine hydroxymethyltransferase, partial [Arenicellales bacterium]|nr:serine hydroxymethyltransferase [Arenicellales bacterium]